MFLLKKFIAAFLMPFPIFMLLLGIGLFFLLFRKQRERAAIFITFALLWISLLSYAPFSAMLLSPLENAYPKRQPGGTPAAYIHVLGYGHDSDDAFPLSSQPYPTGLVRIIEGVMIYRKQENAKLIFSGYGNEDKISNAMANARVAVALGVKPEDIILLEKARDTGEEAEALKKIAGSEKVILVTSAAHMPRAVVLFENAGLDVTAAPTDFRAKKTDWLQLPGAEALRHSEIAFHEYLGMLWIRISE
jgi:uncharacterized SAM-binding protein YcdF (DUF218 family)